MLYEFVAARPLLNKTVMRIKKKNLGALLVGKKIKSRAEQRIMPLDFLERK